MFMLKCREKQPRPQWFHQSNVGLCSLGDNDFVHQSGSKLLKLLLKTLHLLVFKSRASDRERHLTSLDSHNEVIMTLQPETSQTIDPTAVFCCWSVLHSCLWLQFIYYITTTGVKTQNKLNSFEQYTFSLPSIMLNSNTHSNSADVLSALTNKKFLIYI